MDRSRIIKEIAAKGKEALEALHELMGHGRREVRDAAALALGEIADPSSLRYLVAALYGTSKKAAGFRPSTDSASLAISGYPEELRLRACEEIHQQVRPSQAAEILKGLPSAIAYAAFSKLVERKIILLTWDETELDVLDSIDEDRAWPSVKDLVRRREDWKLRTVVKHLSPTRQIECIEQWLPNIRDSWHFNDIHRVIQTSSIPLKDKRAALKSLLHTANRFSGRFDDRESFVGTVQSDLDRLESDTIPPAAGS